VQLQADAQSVSAGLPEPFWHVALQELVWQVMAAEPPHVVLPLHEMAHGPSSEQVTLTFLHTSVPGPLQFTSQAW
jgi:hypothetical protein